MLFYSKVVDEFKKTRNYLQTSFFIFQRFSSLQMESMAYIYFSSPIPGAEFSSEGDLKLNQKYLLPYRGVYTIYNVSLCSVKSSFVTSRVFRSPGYELKQKICRKRTLQGYT